MLRVREHVVRRPVRSLARRAVGQSRTGWGRLNNWNSAVSLDAGLKVGSQLGILNRNQVVVAGGTVGYMVGLLAGPVVKALTGVVLAFAFYFVGKHLDDRFESELGYVGIAAAILAAYLLNPVRHALAGTIGNFVSHTSAFLLAGIGALFAMKAYDRLLDRSDSDPLESD